MKVNCIHGDMVLDKCERDAKLTFSRRSRFESRFSELWRLIVLWWDTSVSEVHAASWSGMQHGPSKRWYPIITLHGVKTRRSRLELICGVRWRWHVHVTQERKQETLAKLWCESS